MSSVSKAKKELQFNREFKQLVDILKQIATSHFQALVQKKKEFTKFTEAFDGFFRLIDLVKINNPFVQSRSETTGVIIVTSDEGFMGGLNTRVIETALAETPGKRDLIVLGSHGATDLKAGGFALTEFPGVVYEDRYAQAVKLKDLVMDWVLQERIGGLIIVYPYPVSFTVQKPRVERLLPCAELFKKQEMLLEDESRVILETPPEKMIAYLVGTWIVSRLYIIFEESKIAEYAARAVHLEQSHDRLVEEGKMLRYRYFRAKREVVDKGIRETFASILLRRRQAG